MHQRKGPDLGSKYHLSFNSKPTQLENRLGEILVRDCGVNFNTYGARLNPPASREVTSTHGAGQLRLCEHALGVCT